MNHNPSIVAIVEGDGEKKSVPDLVRRVIGERLGRHNILVPPPKIAHSKSNLVTMEKLEKFLRYAIHDKCSGILVLVDADEECPLEEAPKLAARAATLNLKVPVAIVYAKSECETWFICSLSQSGGEGIRRKLGIPETVNAPNNVEDITGAKGWLNRNMPIGRIYKETTHQEILTYDIDLDLVHNNSRSFRRLCHAIEELVHAIDNGVSTVTPLAKPEV